MVHKEGDEPFKGWERGGRVCARVYVCASEKKTV